jgi:hypothetical protein
MAGGHKGLGADGLHGLGVDASQQGLGAAGGQHGPGDMAGTGAELELLLLPNTFLQLQNKSPAPRYSCSVVEQQLQTWFSRVGALPNRPLI